MSDTVAIEVMQPGEDGWSEWVHPLPGYLMQCCDCGLIHEMEFAIVPRDAINAGALNEGEGESVIIFRARRNPPSLAEPDEEIASINESQITKFAQGMERALMAATRKAREGGR
jgi:hypothetical protein